MDEQLQWYVVGPSGPIHDGNDYCLVQAPNPGVAFLYALECYSEMLHKEVCGPVDFTFLKMHDPGIKVVTQSMYLDRKAAA